MEWITQRCGYMGEGVCNYLCVFVGRRQRGGGGCVCMPVCLCSCVCVCVCVCVLVDLNLNMEVHVYLHVPLLEEDHCSTVQCTPLTFQLHLSAHTKAFLQALTCVNLLPAVKDSTALRGTRVGGRPAESCLTSCVIFVSGCITENVAQWKTLQRRYLILNQCPSY